MRVKVKMTRQYRAFRQALRNQRNFAGKVYGNRQPATVFLLDSPERDFKMLGTILIVVLLLLLLGAWPAWPHSRSWGYYPSGTLGLVLVIVLVLALLGRV
jgi:hypothetical protein